MEPGLRAIGIREVQKTLAQSSKAIVESKIQALRVGHLFEVQRDQIKTPGGGLIVFQGMQDHTAESIKSLEGFKIAWIDEAQTLSERSLSLLRPTIRVEGSEIWASWNPTRKTDAIDRFLLGWSEEEKRYLGHPEGAVVVTANWRDNPWWSSTLEAERQLELSRYPERYDHTYEGGYAKAFTGAYFAKFLTEAEHANPSRIGNVAADPLMRLRAFWDLGGRGMKSDATAIWIAQFVGREIRVLDYYEAVGQPLSAHVAWLHEKKYSKALCVLPHDGAPINPVADASWQTALEQAGFDTEVIPNQGAGAAKQRIEAARRLFPSVWFNKDTTEAGRDALGWYHEKKSDDERNVGLGPEHDWSSHGADAFGLMCVAYEAPEHEQDRSPKFAYGGGGGWLGA